jgi:simple sugar transport system substrate-binding protein
MKKLLTALALVSGLCFAVSACGGSSSDTAASSGSATSSSSAGSDARVVVIGCTVSDPACAAWKRGADDAAKQVGVTDTYIGADVTAAGLSKAVQTAISSKPDGIAAGDWFPDSEHPLLSQAAKSGMPVMLVNAAPTDWPSLGWPLGFVGESDYQTGVLGGQQLAARGLKHVLCVNHAPGAANLQQRCDGLKSAIAAAGGTTKVLNVPYADSTSPAAVTQDIAGALAGDASLDAVFTLGSSIADDALRAVNGNDKVKVGTTELSSSVLQNVASGKLLFTIDQQIYLQGYYAVMALASEIKYGIHPVGSVNTGPLLITRDNVQRVIQVNKDYPGVRGAS